MKIRLYAFSLVRDYLFFACSDAADLMIMNY